MKIKIRGTSDNYFRKQIRESLNLYFDYLFSDSRFLKRQLEIEVNIRKELGYYGLCCPQDAYIELHPIEFLIEVEKELNNREILKTLAHEMIHVKQFVYNQLSVCGTKWKGRKFKDVVYSRSPWEKEAYLKEDAVYAYYMKYRKYK